MSKYISYVSKILFQKKLFQNC